MLKKIIGLTAASALALHFGIASANAADAAAPAPVGTPAPYTTASADVVKLIGEAKAREIALAHAQLSPQNVQFIRVKLDREFLHTKYELEFMADGVKYEYDINAESGQIIKFWREAKHGGKYRGSEAPQGGLIGADRAREIALSRVPGATDRNIREFKLDYDHGMQVYEGEIVYNWREYEFKIDAVTGELIEWKLD